MSTAVDTHRPGAAAWLTLTVCEAKMVARDTAGLVVPIGLPLLILIMSASSASSEIVANGRSVLDVFVLPLVFTIIIATIGVINMPSFLAYYRRTGILRRLSVTPASPAMVLVAQVVVSVLQTWSGSPQLSSWPLSSSTPACPCISALLSVCSCCRWRRCTPSE